MFKSFALCALAGVAAAWGGHGWGLGSSYGGHGIGRTYGGHNIHGTKSDAGRRSAGSFGQGATVRGHSGEQSFSKGGYGSGYSQQYDVNDERVSRYNDGKAARGGYTESVNYGYGKRTGGKHQTGNLNGLNLGRQSAGYGDNYAHVGATENDYRPAKNVYNGGYGYGVATGYGYDNYAHVGHTE